VAGLALVDPIGLWCTSQRPHPSLARLYRGVDGCSIVALYLARLIIL
jgi:hypothetical protein